MRYRISCQALTWTGALTQWKLVSTRPDADGLVVYLELLVMIFQLGVGIGVLRLELWRWLRHIDSLGLQLLALWAQKIAIYTLEGIVFDFAVSIDRNLFALVDQLLVLLLSFRSLPGTEVSRFIFKV